jgi:hypothetical protein
MSTGASVAYRIITVTAGLAVAAMLGYAIWMILAAMALGDMCQRTLLGETTSPDGRLRAAISIFGCGATTTSDTYGLAILEADEEFDDDTPYNVFASDGAYNLDAEWITSDTLVVRYNFQRAEHVGIGTCECQVQGVTIVYQDSRHRAMLRRKW